MPTSTSTFGDRLTRFLNYESVRTAEDTASSWISARPDLLNQDGTLMAMPLAFLVDSTPGVVCGAAATPDWVVTTDLHMHVLDPQVKGRIRADAKLVRASRVGVLGEVVVVDEGDDERVLAVGSVNHGRVPLTGGLDVPQMPVGVPFRSPDQQPTTDDIGIMQAPFITDSAGAATHEMTSLTTNPLGILHGSVIGSLAIEAALACAGAGWRVSDVILRFVGGIRQGPARAVPQLLSKQQFSALVRVNVYDEAQPSRVATAAWITLARSAAG